MQPTPGYESAYSITEDGCIWSHLSNSWKAHVILQLGYHTVSLRGTTEYVHLLILRTYVGPKPEGAWGLHRDDNKDRNILSNLYWGTPKQNAQDALANNITHVGERNHMSKITEEQVKHIRAAYAQGDSQNLIALEFRIGQTTVSNIVNRNTWKHILDVESVRPVGLARTSINDIGGNRVVNAKLVREIRERFSEGETQTALSLDLNIHQTTISLIVRRKTWSHIE